MVVKPIAPTPIAVPAAAMPIPPMVLLTNAPIAAPVHFAKIAP